jgi:hypothetical protein
MATATSTSCRASAAPRQSHATARSRRHVHLRHRIPGFRSCSFGLLGARAPVSLPIATDIGVFTGTAGIPWLVKPPPRLSPLRLKTPAPVLPRDTERRLLQVRTPAAGRRADAEPRPRSGPRRRVQRRRSRRPTAASRHRLHLPGCPTRGGRPPPRLRGPRRCLSRGHLPAAQRPGQPSRRQRGLAATPPATPASRWPMRIIPGTPATSTGGPSNEPLAARTVPRRG